MEGRRGVLVGVACAVLVLVGLSTAGPATVPQLFEDQRFVVTDEDGSVLIDEPVEDGDEVRLEYTHSVEKTLVSDIYIVNGTTLESTRMEFDSYGAGLPSNADVERTDDGRFVTETDGTHDRLIVSPGEIAGHTLTVNDTTYDLVALADGSVSLTVTDRNPA